MAIELPRVLKNMNLFVDGRGYAGRIDEIQLPKLTLKTEEHRAGGMDLPVEIDPPEHAKYRAFINPLFTPAAMSTAPSSEPQMLPRPPKSEVPPRMTAAMAVIQCCCAASSGACSAYTRFSVMSWKEQGCGYCAVSATMPGTCASAQSARARS